MKFSLNNFTTQTLSAVVKHIPQDYELPKLTQLGLLPNIGQSHQQRLSRHIR